MERLRLLEITVLPIGTNNVGAELRYPVYFWLWRFSCFVNLLAVLKKLSANERELIYTYEGTILSPRCEPGDECRGND